MTKLSSGSDGKAGKVSGDDKDSNQHRKARRCWSPELHRRFLDALQQLGGSHGKKCSLMKRGKFPGWP